MKRIIFFLCLLMLVFFLVACSSQSSSDAEDETIVLRAGTNLPASHYLLNDILKPMLDRLEEETDHRIKFELYDSESLVRAGEEMEALRSGTIDIALPIYDVYDTNRFPFAEIPLLPVSNASMEVYSKATVILRNDDEPYSDGLTHSERLYGEKGLIGWPFTMGRSYTIGTVTSPIESLDQFRAMQIRIPSNVHEIFSRNLGFSPSSISANEAYDAFNRGTLDGGFTPITDWPSYGLDEVFTYVIDGIHAGSWPSTVAMTEERFEELPEDIQEIFQRVIEEELSLETNPRLIEFQNNLEEEIMQSYLDNGGIVEPLEELPEEVQERIEDGITQTWLDWIEDMERYGEPGKEAAIKWRDAILEAGGEVPEGVMEIE
ncbi:hypothetical protein GCM10008931_44930 [Oceanobacillus oncorhynchi subsp. oncorhynchi]|uniref:TRAP transporter substrate-binding protein n=1 Tax=Oceanobacillus oncorhynchi TaxID=545501 RepID=UPI0031D5C611